jgi:3-phenylpropionate/trans-cinnamate dioxygenase ferredoxin subunit
VARVQDVPDGGAVVVDRSVAGTGDDVAVFHDGGEFFALDDTCTHQEASLADGWVEDGEVECPLHAARFSLRSGEALSLPAVKAARCHRVEVRDDEVWLLPGTPCEAQA